MKDQTEIEEAAERAAKLHNQAERKGPKYPNMTYEQGVRDVLDWVGKCRRRPNRSLKLL
jgi:hypothetical protein